MENQKILDALAKQPQAFPSSIAQELGVSEWAVVSQLPEENMQEVSSGAFDEIMKEVTTWGEITFLVRNASVISEVKGILPPGTHGHGYFNFAHGASSIGGHISVGNLGSICFVNRPSFGLESLSIQFYDKQGDAMFKIYLARSSDKKIIPEQKKAYENLKNRLLNKE